MEPIRSIYEDDPDMMEIVREFAGELGDRAAQAKAHLESREWDALQTLAHQLKGAGGGYGFSQITEVAASLEMAIREGADPSVLKDRTTHLCETLAAVAVSEAD